MRRYGIEPTFAICDVPLYDDPHWHSELETFCCEQHCDDEGCLQFSPATGLLPDDSDRFRPGDDSATRSAVVPAVGELHA